VTLPGAHLLPDARRRGIVINLADQRLYYFPKGALTVVTFPIGTPRDGTIIPIGATTVVDKRPNPTWFPPPSVRAENPDLPESVPPGPDNPLGAFALSLGWPSYVIHGTNKPDGVGRRVSRGCIRLYPESIETLYPMVPVGTWVTTVDQPVKFGMADGALYLEVHPTQAEIDEVEAGGAVESPAPLAVETYLRAKAGKLLDRVDWPLVERTTRERRGFPVRITP
jgi:L,D-transpeptidase ErfK/SrfK